MIKLDLKSINLHTLLKNELNGVIEYLYIEFIFNREAFLQLGISIISIRIRKVQTV